MHPINRLRTASGFLFFFILLFPGAGFCSIIRGTVTDSSGDAIPYASVFIKNSSYGVACDAEGSYFLEVPAGKYTISFSAIGYVRKEEPVIVNTGQTVTLNVNLRILELSETVISAKYVDRGREIMRHAREMGSIYNDAVNDYTCDTYQKISIDKKNPKEEKKDSTRDAKEKIKKEKKAAKSNRDTTHIFFGLIKKKPKKKSIAEKTNEDWYNIKKMDLIESFEETDFSKPHSYKEVIKGYHDFSDVHPLNTGGSGEVNIALGYDYGEQDISAVSYEYDDPYVIKFNPSETDFNFYRNQINAPNLCLKPLISPLATLADLSYTFSLDTAFYENGKKIFCVQVKPRFKSEPLFAGKIYIEDSSWIIKSVDLGISPEALTYCTEFHINQDYTAIENGIYLPTRREFTYTVNDGGTIRKGNTRIDHSNYRVNKGFPKGYFGNEVATYDVNAFNHDTAWWNNLRPITLKPNELNYIHQSDSFRNFFQSDAYLDSVDAEYNHLTFWNYVALGIGHKNHKRGLEYNVSPLIEQLNPFGIGGYRHMLSGEISKEIKKNNDLIETRGMIDYGVINHDIRGKVGIGLTYVPKKFVRTFIDVGDYYDVINSYPSLGTLFSRANYVRARTFSISQRMEVINGLFAELTLDYARLDPLVNIKLEQWTQKGYGELNKPIDFEPYNRTEAILELKYRPGQKYIIKGNKKIITSSKYPEFSIKYRKGLNGIFNSEVNFDYLEYGVKDEVQLSHFGYGSWSFLGGSFLNTASLRVIEYKYFRGSDPFIFSNPLNSFQLLGPTLNTHSSYLRANGIFHDQGYIFNKIPVLNKCRLGLAGGAGMLLIPDENFRHAEMFGGIEWTFRIKKQNFRTGIYGVTADNTISLPKLTWKMGLSIYNSYRKKWDY